MARVTLPMGIEKISGKLGNYCFRTMKATGRVYMYTLKEQMDKEPSTKEVSERAIAQRERFSIIAGIVRMMRKAGSKKTQKELWKIAAQAV